MTPFLQSNLTALATLRDMTFDRMKIIPYLRREVLRTLGGLKTGIFSYEAPESIAGTKRRVGQTAEDKTATVTGGS